MNLALARERFLAGAHIHQEKHVAGLPTRNATGDSVVQVMETAMERRVLRPTRRTFLAGVALAALGGLGLAAGCSPLKTLDALMPADGGVTVAAADVPFAAGDRRRLDVYVPEGRPGPLPVVVFTYGGSWASGSKDEYDFAGRAFAALGYVTVVYDYRLVPEVVFPGFVEDGALAVRWVRDTIARYGGDPDRIILAGHSAGAYSTAMLALDRRFLRTAGVPVSAIRGAIGLAGPYDFLPLDVDATRDAFGAAPDLPATQPVNHVRGDAPPFFLATGDADETVRPRNTAELARRLRAAGAPVVEKSYPDIGHVGLLLALGRPFRGRAPVLADIEAFLRGSAVSL
jgi:acetyl esterase/lipase